MISCTFVSFSGWACWLTEYTNGNKVTVLKQVYESLWGSREFLSQLYCQFQNGCALEKLFLSSMVSCEARPSADAGGSLCGDSFRDVAMWMTFMQHNVRVNVSREKEKSTLSVNHSPVHYPRHDAVVRIVHLQRDTLHTDNRESLDNTTQRVFTKVSTLILGKTC